MDPIKVDFSDSKKKKSVKDVLIPPEKAGIKTVINIVITLVVALVTYYFMLPPMNLQSYDFYIYWAIVIASYVGAAFITSSAISKSEYVPYAKKHAKIPVIVLLVLAVVVGIGYLVSSPFFRAKDYASILSIEPADFDATFSNIEEISDFNKIPLIDKETSKTLADKTLGEFATMNLESQFELLDADSTQINYKGSPYRVYPLQYGDIFKWFTNSTDDTYDGIPGYVIVNLNTQKAELITDYQIKYSTAEHFGEYLERHLRFEYPTEIFGEISFEINEEGRPYWVVETIRKQVGLFGGDDVKGIITVDAESGEFKEYSAEQLKADDSEINWIDQAYDADLLVQQYNYLGKYLGGFWNSIFGQAGVKQASQGYSFLAMDDDVYLYTGVTSVNTDESILGFFFINQRTKDGYFYNISEGGATEAAAQKSAEGKVQDMGWKASFPILLNIDGEATYFMSLKDDASIVKSYALVNVRNYNVVSIPAEKDDNYASAVSEYIKGLAAIGTTINVSMDNATDTPDSPDTPDVPDDTSVKVAGVITDIRTTVVSGNTYFYIELDNSDVYYYAAAKVSDKTVLFNNGDEITVTIANESDEKLIEAIDMQYTADVVIEEAPTEDETPAEDETPTEDEISSEEVNSEITE